MSPRAGALGFRMTTPVIVALAAIGLMFLLTLVGLGLLLTGKDRNKGVKQGAPRILQLDTEPSNVELRHNGVTYRTPATLIVEQGGTATVEIVHDGKTTALQLQVPLGAEPVKKTIPLTAP